MLGKGIFKKKQNTDLKESFEHLQREISEATRFVRQIEEGNLEATFNEDATGELSESLVRMRDHIKKINAEENQRNWITTGLAKFADILRNTDQDDGSTIYDTIVSNLVKYMGANQGGLFSLNDDNENDIFIEMLSCYAYDRKKFDEKKILVGEGMVGQVYLEGKTTYLKVVPEHYINITSGLGKATPKNILIVPLKINDKVYGVLELASFNLFEEYQINFVEKLGENIASAISNTKNIIKTKELLESSQMQSEMLRAQEEEMRQNMEELQATQEQMERKQNDVEKLNDKLSKNEDILKKALEKAKEKEKDIITKNAEIEAREAAITKKLSEVEFYQTEAVSKKEELEKITKKLESNQQILVKANMKSKEVQTDLKKQLLEKETKIKELEQQLKEKA